MNNNAKLGDADVERRLRVLLPATYDVFDDEVQPQSMGSAGLKYGPDGAVQWDRMWDSFCDLAMAGGPPHRGTFLDMQVLDEATREDPNCIAVANEICRGLGLVTALCAEPSPTPGSVTLYCTSAAMTGWLMRAITMENVSARASGLALHLPAGPGFRLEKEVKNVITAVAKTCHYWQDHMPEEQHDRVAELLRTMEGECRIIFPVPSRERSAGFDRLAEQIAASASRSSGLPARPAASPGWLALECGKVAPAIWLMRALAVRNLLTRREGTTVLLPLDREWESPGNASKDAVVQTCEFARRHQVF